MRTATSMAKAAEPPTNSTVAQTAPADEVAWLSDITRGNPDAFRAVVARYLPHLLTVARRMLRDDAEAEDVAQDALLRLWRNAATLELGPGGLAPWLRRVVSNLCIDRVRSGKRLTVVEELPEVSSPADQQHALEEGELSSRVDAALKSLPERQRAALVLFHYEGLSLVEVGDALGVSGEAVESLLARARRSLKSALANEWRQLLPDEERQP